MMQDEHRGEDSIKSTGYASQWGASTTLQGLNCKGLSEKTKINNKSQVLQLDISQVSMQKAKMAHFPDGTKGKGMYPSLRYA